MSRASLTQRFMQRAGLVPACLLFSMLTAADVHAVVDSASAARHDSVHRPLTTLGRVADSTMTIGKQALRTIQYRSLPEIVTRATTALPRSLGGFGQQNAFSFYGEDPIAQSISVNGRRLVEPWSDQLHLEQIAPEAIERIELLHGTDAVGLGGGMSLHALNMQQIIYNTAMPITRIWYAQGGGDLVAGDVTVSQNVAPDLNATIGIRRSGANGRYDRTDFDVWNVRAAMRWTAARRTHLTLTYDLASLNTDLWGGVRDTLSTTIDETTSLPIYASLREESRRHDVQLTMGQVLSDDSSGVFTASAYVSTTDMLRQRDTTIRVGDDDNGSWQTLHGRMFGAQVRLAQRVGTARLHVGAGAERSTNDATFFAPERSGWLHQAWGHLALPIGQGFGLRAAGRVASSFGQTLLGAGIALGWRPMEGWNVDLDASIADRAPTLIEGADRRPERHMLVLGRATLSDGDRSMRVEVFYRRIGEVLRSIPQRNADGVPIGVTTTQGGERRIVGAICSASARWWNLQIDPVVRVMASAYDGADDQGVPVLSGHVTVAYVYETGVNSVRLGATMGLLSSYAPPIYVPLAWTTVGSTRMQPVVTNGLDLHLTALVGDAAVRLAWENVLGSPWSTVAGHPEIGRNVRLSLHWSFFD